MAAPHVLSASLKADLMRISNAELSKAIQLADQAFQLTITEPTRAFNLFEKSSISFLQAIRTSDADNKDLVRRVVDIYILYIEIERMKLSARVPAASASATVTATATAVATSNNSSPPVVPTIAIASEPARQSGLHNYHQDSLSRSSPKALSSPKSTLCVGAVAGEDSGEKKLKRLSRSDGMLQARGMSHSYLQLVEEDDDSDTTTTINSSSSSNNNNNNNNNITTTTTTTITSSTLSPTSGGGGGVLSKKCSQDDIWVGEGRTSRTRSFEQAAIPVLPTDDPLSKPGAVSVKTTTTGTARTTTPPTGSPVVSKKRGKEKKEKKAEKEKEKRKETGLADGDKAKRKTKTKEKKKEKKEKKEKEKKEKKEKRRKEKREKEEKTVEREDTTERLRRRSTPAPVHEDTLTKRPDGPRTTSAPSPISASVLTVQELGASNASTPSSTTTASSAESEEARLLRALNGWRKTRGLGSSDILGYCSPRAMPLAGSGGGLVPAGSGEEVMAMERGRSVTSPSATDALYMYGATEEGVPMAGEPGMDELQRLYPKLHSSFSRQMIGQWAQESTNNTI